MKKILIYGSVILLIALITYVLHYEYQLRYLTHREQVEATEALEVLDILKQHIDDGGLAYELPLLDAEKAVARARENAKTSKDSFVALNAEAYLSGIETCRSAYELARNNEKLRSSGISIGTPDQDSRMINNCSIGLGSARKLVVEAIDNK